MAAVELFDKARADRAQKFVEKLCPKCKTIKPLDAFTKNKARGDGLSWSCRTCNKSYMDAWNTQNPTASAERYAANKDYFRAASNKAMLKRYYGLTPEDYDDLLHSQGGVCAICGNECASGRRLSVDHDHGCCPSKASCGKCIRGLLCGNCNQGLGSLKDSPVLLRSAISYLEGEVS